jgi:flagellar biogenesis protein FliO
VICAALSRYVQDDTINTATKHSQLATPQHSQLATLLLLLLLLLLLVLLVLLLLLMLLFVRSPLRPARAFKRLQTSLLSGVR